MSDIEDYDDAEIAFGFNYRFGDIDRLAEMIAAGETKMALDALHDLFPDEVNPATVMRLVADRRAAGTERLF